MTATTHTPKKSEGALITIAQLEDDPYPIYARVQQREPISRIPALGMWYVTRYEDVRAILMDNDRSARIMLFGGISTVEALILNSLWALFMHPETVERVRGDPSLFPAVIDETIRWLNPVQSAGTHACLGLHLAELEARIAVEDLVRELPDLRLIDPVASTPRGYEFRQPRAMPVMWETDDSKGPT